jgi:hypothetical protein
MMALIALDQPNLRLSEWSAAKVTSSSYRPGSIFATKLRCNLQISTFFTRISSCCLMRGLRAVTKESYM